MQNVLKAGDSIDAWVVESHLGSGGMASVFRCRNSLIEGIDAAVKVLRPTGGVLQERERFFREVKALHRLRHPAIVRVNGWGEDAERGLLWMAMDLVEGQDMSHVIGRGPTEPATVERWLRSLCQALSHAHGQGTFHRDLKPANIVVDGFNQPILVDFGISVQSGETRLTQTGMLVGTPSYMPPEVFDGVTTSDAAAEVYALGQVMCEALRGAEAFPGDTADSTGRRIVALMAAKVKAVDLDPGPGTPEPLRSVVRGMTCGEPDQRLSSMAEVLKALDAPPMTAAPAAEPAPPVTAAPAAETAPAAGVGTEWVRQERGSRAEATTPLGELGPEASQSEATAGAGAEASQKPGRDGASGSVGSPKGERKATKRRKRSALVPIAAVLVGLAAILVVVLVSVGALAVVGAWLSMDLQEPEIVDPLASLQLPPPNPDADPRDEDMARTLHTAAADAVKDLRNEDAARSYYQLVRDHPETRGASLGLERSLNELDVVGTEVPALRVERWFQGASDPDASLTLLMFWEEWCPHCKRELPKQQKLHESWAARGVSVVGITQVSKTSTDDKVRDYLAQQKITFPVAKDNAGAMSKLLGVKGIPAMALVREGRVIWRGHPAKVDDALLARSLLSNTDAAIGQTRAIIEQVRPLIPEPPPKPTYDQDQEAKELYSRMASLDKEGKLDEALALGARFEDDLRYTSVAAPARGLMDRLRVMGKTASELDVERWFQGASSIGEGRATVLVFWEPWCPHCQREVPKLEQLHRTYRPRGLNIVGLTRQSRNGTDEQVYSFISQHGVTFPIGKDGGELTKFYAVSGVPAAAVVKDGVVVWRGHPAKLDATMIEGWLR